MEHKTPQHLHTCEACGKNAGWTFVRTSWMPAKMPTMIKIVARGGGIQDESKPNQVGLDMYTCNNCHTSEPDVPKE